MAGSIPTIVRSFKSSTTRRYRQILNDPDARLWHMEGALFSVLGGLIGTPLIAVPTSVGHGVSAGGRVSLHAALASCAPGLVCVNIDNGYGAACAALRILRGLRGTDP